MQTTGAQPFFFASLIFALAGFTSPAHAAPDKNWEMPLDPAQQESAPASAPPYRLDQEGLLQIAPAPKVSADPDIIEKQAKFTDQHAFGLRAAILQDTSISAGANQIGYLEGAFLRFPMWDLAWEIGGDVISTNRGAVHLMPIVFFYDSGLRPFAKAGVGIEVDPTQALGAFFVPNNLQLRAALGCEQNLTSGLILRAEFDFNVSGYSDQADLGAAVLYSW